MVTSIKFSNPSFRQRYNEYILSSSKKNYFLKNSGRFLRKNVRHKYASEPYSFPKYTHISINHCCFCSASSYTTNKSRAWETLYFIVSFLKVDKYSKCCPLSR